MHVKSNMVGAPPEVTTRSLGRKTESGAVDKRTVAEGILVKNSVLEKLQSGSSKQLAVQSDHLSKESDNDIQDLTVLRPFSSQLNGIADGLGEVALETVLGVAELGVSGVKTGYNLLLGPSVSELEFAAEEITGHAVQFPEWAPNSDRGVDRLKTGAGVIAEVVGNPGLIVDAVVDPIKEDWNQGRYGEAVGRGIGELVSVTAGAQGAGELVKELDILELRSGMEWSPDKASPWTKNTTLLQEINRNRPFLLKNNGIRDYDMPIARANCINCVIMTDAALGGNPGSANIMYKQGRMSHLEKFFDSKFSDFTDLQSISKQLLENGHGARGIVAGNKGLYRLGHVFNIYNDHGVIKYIDGQTGFDVRLNGEGYQGFAFLLTNSVDKIDLAKPSIGVLQAIAPGVDRPEQLLRSASGELEASAETARQEASNVDPDPDAVDPELAEVGPVGLAENEVGKQDVSAAEREGAPEPELEESVDPVIENALVDLGIESDFVVASYDEGIAAINAVREVDGHAPLTVEEGAIALRVYNASLATEGSSGGALATAAIALDPDNKAMLDKIVKQHETIESGEITLSSVMGLGEPGQARSAADVAIAGTNIARLNNTQEVLDKQAANEIRMLHTGVTKEVDPIHWTAQG